jgi:hypothetical protein
MVTQSAAIDQRVGSAAAQSVSRLWSRPRQYTWQCLRATAGTTSGRLFVFFLCLYTLTYRARLSSADGTSMYLTAQGIVDRGSLAISEYGVPGRGGLLYSIYGIGTSLVELPLYVVGKGLGHFAGGKADQLGAAITLFVFPLLCALCCAMAHTTARALDYPKATAVRAALVLGLATSLWPYAKTDFAEPLLTLCLVAAGLCAVLGARHHRLTEVVSARHARRYDVLLGVALGGALLVKYIALAFVPVFCLYAALTLPQPRTLGRWVGQQARILVPVFVGGLVVLLVNDLRFGSPFETGYPPGGRLFSGSLVEGITGLLFSTDRGMLFYDPLLLAGLVALPLLLWRRPVEALLPAGLLGLSLLLYGGFVDWEGGASWGPRYLVPILPFLLWPLLALGWFGSTGARGALLPERWRLASLVGAHSSAVRRLLGAVVALLVAVSVVPQVLGVVTPFGLYYVYFGWAGHAPLGASALVFAAWALPFVLQFALTRTLPTYGLPVSQYPFGPPFPTDPHLPIASLEWEVQSFWFSTLPHPQVVLAAGCLVLGVPLLLLGYSLWRAATSP